MMGGRKERGRGQIKGEEGEDEEKGQRKKGTIQ